VAAWRTFCGFATFKRPPKDRAAIGFLDTPVKTIFSFLAFVLTSLSLGAEEIHSHLQTGTASWYGVEGSRKTASGERYDPSAMTAAHRTLPLGTLLQVRNLNNGCCATVRVNDRGPYCKGRIVDVSKAAAQQLKMMTSGTAKVQLAVIK